MKNNLIDNLKSLRFIKPDVDYSQKSLNLILAEKRIATKEIFNPSAFEWLGAHKVLIFSGATSVLTLILIIASVISYLPGNKNSLVAEANDINNSIQISLNEIKYQLSQPLSSSTIININDLLLAAENELKTTQDLDINDAENLKEILDKIKNTRDALEEINSQLNK